MPRQPVAPRPDRRCTHLVRRFGPERTGLYVGLCDAPLDDQGRCTLSPDVLGHRSKPDK